MEFETRGRIVSAVAGNGKVDAPISEYRPFFAFQAVSCHHYWLKSDKLLGNTRANSRETVSLGMPMTPEDVVWFGTELSVSLPQVSPAGDSFINNPDR